MECAKRVGANLCVGPSPVCSEKMKKLKNEGMCKTVGVNLCVDPAPV
jgi:hypothetical protein